MFLLFVFPIFVFGQNASSSSTDEQSHYDFNDCWGAINMETNTSKNIRLKGEAGKTYELQHYFAEQQQKENNSVWLKCKPNLAGFLSITLEEVDFPFNYLAFLINKNQDCQSIQEGTIAPVEVGEIRKQNALIFLIDSLKIEENQHLILCLNALSNAKSKFSVITSFTQHYGSIDELNLRNMQDFRHHKKEEAFHIKIRDAVSGKPVSAKVIISESRDYNALYRASDFIFPAANNLKMQLKIDAQNYFPKDETVSSRNIENNELLIELEPIAKNQLIELEGLEFVAQAAVLLPEAYPKLQRLKDFMTINDTIEIEIQGHVHLIGKNTFKAKRLSRKRARKVRRYLIDSGIDKSRMDIVGFGNAKMKYPNTEIESQIQENRRVEIRIK